MLLGDDPRHIKPAKVLTRSGNVIRKKNLPPSAVG